MLPEFGAYFPILRGNSANISSAKSRQGAECSLQNYYAQPASSVLGSISHQANAATIPFRWLLGEFHWKRRFEQLYKDQRGQWLTPTEVFKPYYSSVIARYIATGLGLDHNRPLSIIELGGGRGTNALSMMDFLEQTFPQLYENTNYTIIDASPTLIELQQETLRTCRHSRKMHFSQKDLFHIGEGKAHLCDSSRTKDPMLTQYFILGLELLDNLAHDKIRVQNTKVEQAELVAVGGDDACNKSNDPVYNEVFAPLSDPLLKQILQLAPIYKRIRGAAWIPSIACGLFRSISTQRA